MKKLIYAAAAVSVGLTPFIPIAQATEVSRNVKSSYIVHSVAYPKSSKIQNATYHIGIAVAGNSLSQLAIEIPKLVHIGRGVEITDQSGKKLMQPSLLMEILQ